MKRNILLQFEDEDDYADVLVAIRTAHGSSTKDPAERGAAIAQICRRGQATIMPPTPRPMFQIIDPVS